jgi:hypothetical protein
MEMGEGARSGVNFYTASQQNESDELVEAARIKEGSGMKLWRLDLIIIFALLFVACPLDDCDSAAGPSSIITTTTTTVESKPPRVDQEPDLWSVRGCTAFGAANLTESELTAFISHIQGKCDMLRTGAQTDGWRGMGAPYLEASVGPRFFTPEWQANLERFLDVTARMGINVQLIPTFTHKQAGYARCMEITKRVVEIQQAGSDDDPTPYRHIVWSAVNEWKHPISKLNRGNVIELLRYLKRETGLAVGADMSGGTGGRGGWIGEYDSVLLPFVDYVAFHPPRYRMFGDNGCESRRPNYWDLRKTVARHLKPVWIDEPTCFISDASKALYGIERSGHYALCGGGTEDQRKKHIRDYKWNVEHAGAIWFTHATWLFECRRLGWLP